MSCVPPPPNRVVPPPQVLEKYGDIYGRERIAELLGMDLASLDIGAQGERKAPPDSSLLTWWVRGAHLEAGGGGSYPSWGFPSHPHAHTPPPSCRITSIDIRYQIWKFGVIFTDNVSGGGLGRSGWGARGDGGDSG